MRSDQSGSWASKRAWRSRAPRCRNSCSRCIFPSSKGAQHPVFECGPGRPAISGRGGAGGRQGQRPYPAVFQWFHVEHRGLLPQAWGDGPEQGPIEKEVLVGLRTVPVHQIQAQGAALHPPQVALRLSRAQKGLATLQVNGLGAGPPRCHRYGRIAHQSGEKAGQRAVGRHGGRKVGKSRVARRGRVQVGTPAPGGAGAHCRPKAGPAPCAAPGFLIIGPDRPPERSHVVPPGI